MLETSHPPNYYFPLTDVDADALALDDGSSWCEWKGRAHYYRVDAGEHVVRHGAWGSSNPAPPYRALAETVAFYPALMDACYVDDELVRPQAGGFYGGWITTSIVGPFKGEAGTHGW